MNATDDLIVECHSGAPIDSKGRDSSRDCDVPPFSVSSEPVSGVVQGVLVYISEEGVPFVSFSGNPCDEAIGARTTVALTESDVSRNVILAFEHGDPLCPIILGCLVPPAPQQARTLAASVDKEVVTLTAEKEIVLRCGKASITLTRAGKILLRGAYILSRSSGANRIKGGSVQIN